jgi:uncharacterized protein
MPTILDRLNADLKTAMKARDTERMDTLRMAISAIKYRQIDAAAPLGSAEEEDVLRKQVKQRDDSIEQFAKAGRQELADKETRERAILGEYLPKELTETELRAMVDALVAGLPAAAAFPDAMKAAMGALKDKAPGKAIQAAVRAALDARVSP